MTNFYNQYGGNYNPNQNGSTPYNPTPQGQSTYGLLGQINEFAKTIQNPEQTGKELLASGRMTQEQFQQYSQIAKMLMNLK